MKVLALLAVLGLAGCGADGEPEPHAGAGVSGEAEIGVVGAL